MKISVTKKLSKKVKQIFRAHPLVQPIMARIKSELHGFDKEHNGQSKTTELANKVEKTVKKESIQTKIEVEDNETENLKPWDPYF